MPSGFGVEFKEAMTESGEWYASLSGFGECLPYFENKVEINKNVVDKWGIPVLHISADWFENELQLYKDIRVQAAEMLEACGIKNIQTIWDIKTRPSWKRNSRNGDSPDGGGSEEVCSQQMESDARHPKPFCDRWFVHGVIRLPKSLHYLYGPNGRAANYSVDQMRKGEL